MENKLIFDMRKNSWLENAGLVGLTRVLGKEAEDLKEGSVFEISANELDGFGEKYFDWLAKTYGRYTKIHEIIKFRSTLEEWQNDDFHNFGKEQAEIFKEGFLKLFKETLNQQSFVRLIGGTVKVKNKPVEIKGFCEGSEEFRSTADEIMEKAGEISGIKPKNDENLDRIRETTRELTPKLLKCIEFYSNNSRYFYARLLAYKVIALGYSNVSFLNRQNTAADFIQEYQDYFVKPVQEFLRGTKGRKEYQCAACGRLIGKEKLPYKTFLTGIGYDYDKKRSNAWNMQNDLYICPVCQWLYSLLPLGFTYNISRKDRQGIFLNENYSLSDLVKANNEVLRTIKDDTDRQGQNRSAYATMMRSFEKEFEREKSDTTLANVQVVMLINGKYVFAIVPEIASKVMKRAFQTTMGKDHANLITILQTAGVKDYAGNDYFSIYDAVVQHLNRAQKLTDLIQFALSGTVTQNENWHVSRSQIMALMSLNQIFIDEQRKEDNFNMDYTKEELSLAYNRGMSLRRALMQRSNNDKTVSTLAYKLLQALKGNDLKKFLDLLFNVYLYTNRVIPRELITSQNDKEKMRELGYGIVAGLTADGDKAEKKTEDNED